MRVDLLAKTAEPPGGVMPFDVVERFRGAYDDLRERVYARRLPPWPGADLVDTFDVITAVNAWRGPRGQVRSLGAFTVSAHVTDEGVLEEAFRHETAHVAAMVFDAHWEHGLSWQRHARACGVAPRATFDGSPWTGDRRRPLPDPP